MLHMCESGHVCMHAALTFLRLFHSQVRLGKERPPISRAAVYLQKFGAR